MFSSRSFVDHLKTQTIIGAFKLDRYPEHYHVGLTIQTLKRRLDFHRQQAAANHIRNMQSLHTTIRKEGIDTFSIRQIDKGQTKKDLEGTERDWIE